MMELESFRNGKIDGFWKIDNEESIKLNFFTYRNRHTHIELKVQRKDKCADIRIIDPKLNILLAEYYSKQDEIADIVHQYLSRNMQVNINMQEKQNKVKFIKSIVLTIMGYCFTLFTVILSISSVLLAWNYYADVAKFLDISSPIWFLIYTILIILIAQLIFLFGLKNNYKSGFYKNEAQEYIKEKSSYKFTFSDIQRPNIKKAPEE
jgi:hypothetical protein